MCKTPYLHALLTCTYTPNDCAGNTRKLIFHALAKHATQAGRHAHPLTPPQSRRGSVPLPSQVHNDHDHLPTQSLRHTPTLAPSCLHCQARGCPLCGQWSTRSMGGWKWSLLHGFGLRRMLPTTSRDDHCLLLWGKGYCVGRDTNQQSHTTQQSHTNSHNLAPIRVIHHPCEITWPTQHGNSSTSRDIPHHARPICCSSTAFKLCWMGGPLCRVSGPCGGHFLKGYCNAVDATLVGLQVYVGVS